MIPTPVRSEGGLLLIKPPSVSLSVRRTVKSRDLLSLSRVKGGEKLKRERLVAAYTKKGEREVRREDRSRGTTGCCPCCTN